MQEIQAFSTVSVTDGELGVELTSQLRLVQAAGTEAVARADNNRNLLMALMACGLLSTVWVTAIWAYDSRHWHWSFLWWWGEMIIGGFFAFVVGFVVSGVLEEQVSKNAGETSFVIVLAIALSVALFPVLPLAAAAVVLAVAYSSARGANDTLTSAQILADNRAAEYKSFLAHIEAWNSCAEFLNRLRLKIAHNQIPEELVLRAVEGMNAMRAEEKLLLDRVGYMRAIANEGPLGTKTARGELGAALVHDLVEPVARMRRELEKLRELDAKSVAQLQVETGKF